MWQTFITQPVVLGITRHLLTTGGGALVAKGAVDASQMEAISGAALTLVGVGFSIFKNKTSS